MTQKFDIILRIVTDFCSCANHSLKNTFLYLKREIQGVIIMANHHNIGSAVCKNGITRSAFGNSLLAKGVKGEKYDKAMKIFDFYAAKNTSEGSDNNILDEQEQVLARTEFARLNGDTDDNVCGREYSNSSGSFGQKTGLAEYDAADAFMKALEHAASNPGNDNPTGRMTLDTSNNPTNIIVTYGENTKSTKDDIVSQYTYNNRTITASSEALTSVDIENAPVAENTQPDAEPESEPPAGKNNPTLVTFANEAALKNAVAKYLLGNLKLGDFNASDLVNFYGMTFNTGNTDNPPSVTIGNKTYVAKFAAGNTPESPVYMFETVSEGNGVPESLHSAVLNSESTDDVNHYRNRGQVNNEKSTYDAGKGEITNGSSQRQGVSQVQTLSSMIMNNADESTLQLDNQRHANGSATALNGESILASLNTDSDDGIDMSEFIKFLKAAVNEAKETVKTQNANNSRIYAPNVDLDLKDLANIAVVFKHFAGEDNKLQATELNNLLKALKEKSMSKLANEFRTSYTPPVAMTPPRQDSEPVSTPERNPVQPSPPSKPQAPVLEVDSGRVAHVDRTRDNEAVSGSPVRFEYSGGAGGTRTMVTDDSQGVARPVKNANVVEYDDHGLFGWGEKDFIVVYGLQSDVRAERVSGTLKHNMTIKVKDKNGNTTYQRVKYVPAKGGEPAYYQMMSEADQRREALRNLYSFESKNIKKWPSNLKLDYDENGKIIYKVGNSVINVKTAKVLINAANRPNQ